MKIWMVVLAVLLYSLVPLAGAQEEPKLQLNMTLDDSITDTEKYAYAVGYVYVNVTEPPPQTFGMTGLFTFQPFDFEEFFEGIRSFLGL
ncbi:MAG: hypothetical protein JSV63_03105 [Candidatus Aenigmatarchaeota archaeon]|nr:MAG: hypothetical protein JSV63_03105 [Candidatus Aenigmarchaeota archaeon]